MPAAAAAVGEHHDPGRLLRHRQVPGQADHPGAGLHLLARGRRVSSGRRAGLRWGGRGGRALQAGDDLVVAYLGEVAVELADGLKPWRDVHADQLVGHAAEPGLPLWRCDRHGEHHPGRPVRPGDLASRPGGGPGGDTVIDHHRDPPAQRQPCSPGPVPRGAGLYLRLLPRRYRGQLVLRHRGQADDLPVDDPHPILADRAHGQLRLERHPQLADHDHIQRRAKRPGHLQGDRDPAAWQAKHYHRLPAQMLQFRGQLPPRIGTISEHCWSPPGDKPCPAWPSAARDHGHLAAEASASPSDQTHAHRPGG